MTCERRFVGIIVVIIIVIISAPVAAAQWAAAGDELKSYTRLAAVMNRVAMKHKSAYTHTRVVATREELLGGSKSKPLLSIRLRAKMPFFSSGCRDRRKHLECLSTQGWSG